MSRFLVITADVDFEKRVRQAAAGMHGDVQSIIADYLPQGPDDVLRVLSGQLLEVLVLGPGLRPTTQSDWQACSTFSIRRSA